MFYVIDYIFYGIICSLVYIIYIKGNLGNYEDAVVEKVSVKADMDYIITRNVKDHQQGITSSTKNPCKCLFISIYKGSPVLVQIGL